MNKRDLMFLGAGMLAGKVMKKKTAPGIGGLGRGSFNRMEGLIRTSTLKKLVEGINEVADDLTEDGFDVDDIKQFLQKIVNQNLLKL